MVTGGVNQSVLVVAKNPSVPSPVLTGFKLPSLARLLPCSTKHISDTYQPHEAIGLLTRLTGSLADMLLALKALSMVQVKP